MTTSTDLDLSLFDQASMAWSSLPLRVQIYEQVTAWINTGQLEPGAQIPTELELCDLFGISRTVIREALILLEEDSLIVRKRGVGRFVATGRPELGLEQLRPLERVFPDATVERLETLDETVTSLVAQALEVDDPTTMVRRWEIMISTGGDPVCLSEEWIKWPPPATGAAGRLLTTTLDATAATHTSMAAVVFDCCGSAIGPAVSRLTVTSAERRRAGLLGLEEGEPLLALAQTTFYNGRPFLFEKHLVRTDRAPLVVQQRRSGASDLG